MNKSLPLIRTINETKWNTGLLMFKKLSPKIGEVFIVYVKYSKDIYIHWIEYTENNFEKRVSKCKNVNYLEYRLKNAYEKFIKDF